MKAPGKVRRLTAKEWAEAEALWESGTVTYEDLVTKFGINKSSLERHMRVYKIVRGSKAEELKKAAAAAVSQDAVNEALVTAARIKETKERHYTMASNMGKLIWNEILQAKKDGAPVAVALNNLKALKEAMAGLTMVRNECWIVLGLDRPDAVDPDQLPELVISELTAEQIQVMRDRDHTEMDDLDPTPPTNHVAPPDPDANPDDDIVEEE